MYTRKWKLESPFDTIIEGIGINKFQRNLEMADDCLFHVLWGALLALEPYETINPWKNFHRFLNNI